MKVRPPAGQERTVSDSEGQIAEGRGVAAAENGPGRTGADSECRSVSGVAELERGRAAIAAGKGISADELRARVRET